MKEREGCVQTVVVMQARVKAKNDHYVALFCIYSGEATLILGRQECMPASFDLSKENNVKRKQLHNRKNKNKGNK